MYNVINNKSIVVSLVAAKKYRLVKFVFKHLVDFCGVFVIIITQSLLIIPNVMTHIILYIC